MRKVKFTSIYHVVILTVMFAAFVMSNCNCSRETIATGPASDNDPLSEVEQAPEGDSVSDTTAEPIGVMAGKTFTVSLESNPTTGYSWQPEFDSEYLELVGSEFKSDSALMGASGIETFEFKALKQGETEITMIYKRPWENESLEKQVIPVDIKP